ncbi:MAG: CinA family nicotinamide mononucleotide deamidase-related protein [Chitinophagaceae bacterium]
MNQINAAIITIGDELLIGQTIDTNSAWIAQALNQIGISVKRRVAVGDQKEAIIQALDEERRNAAVILLTGGLGPTADDITKPLLCDYFGGKMVVNEAKRAHIIHLFSEVLKRPIIERNLKQAEVPDVCTVLLNERGTAPGMWFEQDGKIFISMPGVPFEMMGIMNEDVLPRLREKFALPPVLHRSIVTAGIGESFLAEKIAGFEAALPPHIKLAYLPNFGMVKLRLSTTGSADTNAEQELETLHGQLQEAVKDVMVVAEDLTIQQYITRLLNEKGATMSTAESCTGGYIAHIITAIPGSSQVYKGSVVTYANEAKMNVLGVKQETLKAFGAVSEPTVQEMAKGALHLLQTTYTVAVSGIMGPDGGSPKKPVGTVCIATGNAERVYTQTYHLRYARERNIEQTAVLALNQLRRFILGLV